MLANKKYTAVEVVKEAGFDPKLIGKVKVRIAGIRGIATPDHKINIQKGVKEVTVVVGDKIKKIAVKGDFVEPVEQKEVAKKE